MDNNTLMALIMAIVIFFSKEVYTWFMRKIGMIGKNTSLDLHNEDMKKIRDDMSEQIKNIHTRISDTRDKILKDSKLHSDDLFRRSEEKRQASMELMMNKLDANQQLFSAKFEGLENLLKQHFNTINKS